MEWLVVAPTGVGFVWGCVRRLCRSLFSSVAFSFLGGLLGAGTSPVAVIILADFPLGDAVHRHSLDRLNAINDSLKNKNKKSRLMQGERYPTQLSIQDLLDTIGQVQEGLQYYQQIRHHLRLRLPLPWMPRLVLLINFLCI